MSQDLYDPQALDQFVEDTGEFYTEDPSEAMFIFPDGRMTSSSESGVRGDDHNVLESYFDTAAMQRPDVISLREQDTEAYYNVVTEGLGAVIVVPETEEILKGSHQKLTPAQREVIDRSGFPVEDFVQTKPLTAEYLEQHHLAPIAQQATQGMKETAPELPRDLKPHEEAYLDLIQGKSLSDTQAQKLLAFENMMPKHQRYEWRLELVDSVMKDMKTPTLKQYHKTLETKAEANSSAFLRQETNQIRGALHLPQLQPEKPAEQETRHEAIRQIM